MRVVFIFAAPSSSDIREPISPFPPFLFPCFGYSCLYLALTPAIARLLFSVASEMMPSIPAPMHCPRPKLAATPTTSQTATSRIFDGDEQVFRFFAWPTPINWFLPWLLSFNDYSSNNKAESSNPGWYNVLIETSIWDDMAPVLTPDLAPMFACYGAYACSISKSISKAETSSL